MAQKTTDERLMELIDNPSMLKRVNKESAKTSLADMFSFARLQNLIKKYIADFDVISANRAAFAVACFITVIFILFWHYTGISYARRLAGLESSGASHYSSLEGRQKLHIINSQDAQMRDIFAVGQSGPADGIKSAPSGGAMEESFGFKLVGIVWTTRAYEAILEDKTTGETIVLGAGDKYKDIKMESVSEDRAVIFYKGGLWELK